MSESQDTNGSPLPGEATAETGDPHDPEPGLLERRRRDVNRPPNPLP